MRRFVILCVVIAVLFAVSIEGQRFRQVCQPNSMFKVKCNTCWCNADGTDMSCTRKKCSQNDPPSWKKTKKMCEPGSYFKMDCNDCKCNDDGTNAACTLKACPRF